MKDNSLHSEYTETLINKSQTTLSKQLKLQHYYTTSLDQNETVSNIVFLS